MDEVESAILDAWKHVHARLLDDPHDLARRLARRRRPLLTQPPRAWCIAVRACDRRIPAHFEDSVTLTTPLLQKLCASVTMPGNLMLDELAGLLGTCPMGLRNARLDGTLRTRHIQGLAGRRGKPVPLVYTDQPLDPGARRFARPDPGWSWTGTFLTSRIPPNLSQTIARVQHYLPHVGRHRYDDNRHPELDAAPPPARSKRLPPPEPDYVWYKWSTADYFLGDDWTNWRKGPDDLGLRPPKWLPKRKQKRRPRPSRSSSSLHFNGNFWICPSCDHRCRTIFYPLPPINLLFDVPRIAKLVDIPRPIDRFACARCHRIRFFTRTSPDAWNQLIAYLTGGLLYGREVPRPAWFTPDRRRPFKPRPFPAPAPRREQVRDLLLQGRPRAAIAAQLKMSIPALTQQINKIYKSERLRGQRALLLKYNQPLPARLLLQRDRIGDLLAAGHSTTQIAAALHIKLVSVERHMRTLRRRGQLPARQSKRDQVATLYTAGLSRREIARQLHMTPQSVSTRLCELRGAHRLPPVRATSASIT